MNFRALAVALFALASTPALADEPFKYTTDQKDACLPDVRKYCKDVHPPEGRRRDGRADDVPGLPEPASRQCATRSSFAKMP